MPPITKRVLKFFGFLVCLTLVSTAMFYEEIATLLFALSRLSGSRSYLQATTVGLPTMSRIQHFMRANQPRKAALKGRGFKPHFSVTSKRMLVKVKPSMALYATHVMHKSHHISVFNAYQSYKAITSPIQSTR